MTRETTPGFNDSARPDPLIGATLGSFRIERMLGRGGMGTVYFGQHTLIGSKVAIKVLHPELAVNPQLVQRFVAEAKAVNRVGHENIVSVYDLNTLPPGRPYLVMEYLEGRALSALLDRPLEPRVLVPILLQACAGLHAAHRQGVVHRDLKPDNIFLVDRANRTEPVVKLLDFGVAKLAQTDAQLERTAAGVMLGTPAFMAPEQWGNVDVDARSDVYALGITAWRALVGRLPFTGKSMVDVLVAHRTQLPPEPHTLNPAIPASLSAVVMKAIAKAPEERFQSAEEMRQALERVLPDIAESGVRRTPSGRFTNARIALLDAKGEKLRDVAFSDLSRGGVFLHCEPPFPEVFNRVSLELPAPSGALRVMAEVVRHVTPSDGRAWGMSPGIGVQFVALSDEARQRLRSWMPPAPPAQPAPARPSEGADQSGGPTPMMSTAQVVELPDYDEGLAVAMADADAEAWANRVDDLLDSWVDRTGGNHYQVLKLRLDADFDEIRRAASDTMRQFLGGSSSVLTQTQSLQLRGAMARVREAACTLLDPKKRAIYDADLGNFLGVALSIGAGLQRSDLEELRRNFLANNPRAAETARIVIDTGDPLLAQGMKGAARELYERGLKQDPLNPELHYRRQRTLQRD